jgi:hypothetical protein
MPSLRDSPPSRTRACRATSSSRARCVLRQSTSAIASLPAGMSPQGSDQRSAACSRPPSPASTRWRSAGPTKMASSSPTKLLILLRAALGCSCDVLDAQSGASGFSSSPGAPLPQPTSRSFAMAVLLATSPPLPVPSGIVGRGQLGGQLALAGRVEGGHEEDHHQPRRPTAQPLADAAHNRST